jgi:uncharacterized DUF497 family protein
MAFTFDPGKSAKNAAERGLPFELVEQIEWTKAEVIEDTRRNYGETRLQVLAPLGGRLYAIVVTPRGEDLRVISLRKASKREVERYGSKDG